MSVFYVSVFTNGAKPFPAPYVGANATPKTFLGCPWVSHILFSFGNLKRKLLGYQLGQILLV